MKKFLTVVGLSLLAYTMSLGIEVDEDLQAKVNGGNSLCEGTAQVQSRTGVVIKTGYNYRGRDTITVETPDGCSATFELKSKLHSFSVGDNIRFSARLDGGFGTLLSAEEVQLHCYTLKFHHDSFTYDGNNKYTWNNGELEFKLEHIRKFRKIHNKANSTFTQWNVCRNSNYTVVGMDYLGR